MMFNCAPTTSRFPVLEMDKPSPKSTIDINGSFAKMKLDMKQNLLSTKCNHWSSRKSFKSPLRRTRSEPWTSCKSTPITSLKLKSHESNAPRKSILVMGRGGPEHTSPVKQKQLRISQCFRVKKKSSIGIEGLNELITKCKGMML